MKIMGKRREMILRMSGMEKTTDRRRRKEGAQSLSSVRDLIGNLHKTIGNQAVQRLFESGHTKDPDDQCAGWFSDHESTSKRAAEHYVRTELTGNRGSVERIECDLFNTDTGAFACTVHFSDGTPIRVIVRKDAIIVGVYPLQTMHPPPDRPLCWYDYTCPNPNRDLVLTKRKCQTSKPSQSAPLPKGHGPAP